MRSLVRLIMVALSLSVVVSHPAWAQAFTRSTAQTAALDALFSRLAVASDEPSARAIADDIWRIWTQPDDPVLAARVQEILTTGGLAGPYSQLPLIDALIADYPEYAEGWNLRATARFLTGDYENSLADIDQTLEREPRHFGAMAGRVLILESQGKHEEARDALTQALKLHPFLPERALFPELGAPPIHT